MCLYKFQWKIVALTLTCFPNDEHVLRMRKRSCKVDIHLGNCFLRGYFLLLFLLLFHITIYNYHSFIFGAMHFCWEYACSNVHPIIFSSDFLYNMCSMNIYRKYRVFQIPISSSIQSIWFLDKYRVILDLFQSPLYLVSRHAAKYT